MAENDTTLHRRCAKFNFGAMMRFEHELWVIKRIILGIILSGKAFLCPPKMQDAGIDLIFSYKISFLTGLSRTDFSGIVELFATAYRMAVD